VRTQIFPDKDLIRVLLVEDAVGDRRLVERILAECSRPVEFSVESFGSLSAAVERFGGSEYDIVLLDLMLPDSSGIEMVRKVRQANPDIPIVVLTEPDNEEAGVSAIENKATDYLVKSQSLEKLLVRKILLALKGQKKKTLMLDTNFRLQEASQELYTAKQELEKKSNDLSKTNDLFVEREALLRKKMEEDLRVSERNLRKVILTSPDGTVILDRDGIVQFVNPAAESLFGRRAEGLLGESFGLPLSKGEAIEVDIVHCGEMPEIAEMRIVETEWNGQSAYLVQLHDITELRLATGRIEHAVKEWQMTFGSITDMISIHDKNGKITQVNKAFADTFGKEPEELIGKTCYEVLHATEQPHPNCPRLLTLKTQEPAKLECFEPRLGIYADVSTFPIHDKNGEVSNCVHIVKNITDHKLAQETLEKANERLKEYSQLKDDFVATVSHELRTPLAIIIGAIRLVLDEIPGEIVPEQRDILATAMENTKRLSKIVDSLLTISKIESGRLDLQISVTDICELVKDTISDYQSIAQEKGIRLDCKVSQTNVDISLDPDKARQILTNLISNSLKFTPEGGWIEVACAEQDGRVVVTVQDSGVGIARDDMPKLFDKFTQFGRTNGPGERGTGLGLAITKKLVEMHGGTIEVESEVGQGTTFTISLPFSTETPADGSSAETDKLVESTLS